MFYCFVCEGEIDDLMYWYEVFQLVFDLLDDVVGVCGYDGDV